MPEPGWYPDPSRRFELRYFDGSAWTPHVSSFGSVGTDPVSIPPVVWIPSTALAPSRGNGLATAAFVVGLCGVLAGASIVFSFVGLPAAIAGLVLGIVALRRSARHPRRDGRAHAIAGIAFGGVGIVISIVGVLVLASWWGDVADEIRDAARQDDWRITVESVAEHATVVNGPTLHSEHLMAVEVTATNRGLDELNVSPYNFHLEDEHGVTYRRCPCRDVPGTLRAPSEGVRPGESITGLVWFIVPDGAEPVVLVWLHDAFGFSRTEFDLPE